MADKVLTVDQLIKELDKYKHKELHVHHTWKPDHSNWAKKPSAQYWQNSMRNYHVKTRKFRDIAQHVTLTPDGKFITGRAFGSTPASIEGHNTTHGLPFMVEMLGNFDTGHDKFEGKQKESMIKLANYFYNKGRYIRFHRENSSKTCPGSSINKGKFLDEAASYGKVAVKPKPKKTWEYYITGSIVRDLQAELNRQFKRNLKVDGYFGDKTIAALVTVRRGAKGNITKIIQRRLLALGYHMGGYGVDGSFGPATFRQVKAFQKDNKLKADGFVNIDTWKALFKRR